MSRSVMYPSDLIRILHRAGGDSRLFCEARSKGAEVEKMYPDGNVRYLGDPCKESTFIVRCSRGVMARDTKVEPDQWFPGRIWERQGWAPMLRTICLNGNIPVPIRMRVHELAEKAGFTGFLTGADYWRMVL